MKRTMTIVMEEFRDDFVVEIPDDPMEDVYDAWIYRKDYGVKHYMFGVEKSAVTEDEFIALVRNNFDEYAQIYEEEVY